MLDELDILKDVSERLAGSGFSFMVTGSMAMNYYAEPRMTRDIDIIVSIQREDVDEIFALFQPHYYIEKESIIASIENASIFNIIHDESIIKVDFIPLKNDPYRKLEFERRLRVNIRDFETFIVSKEDLILSKLVWSKESRSEMQVNDIRNLIRTDYDERYLDTWVQKLGLGTFFEEIRNG